jgi:hypothetical protein
MVDIRESLKKIITECGGVKIIDKGNDNAFSVLFGVGACNKKPVADDDSFGKHVLLERFYKKGKESDAKAKLYPMPSERYESAYLHYSKTAKSMLEFFYRNGYHDAFGVSDGLVSPRLAIVETDDYYDLYAYYAYISKEGIA